MTNLLQEISLGNELVIRKNKARKDLDLCNGVAEKDEETNTCQKCVAVNRTVYRNQNKCTYTHSHCKCTYNFFSGKLSTEFSPGKVTNYLFRDADKLRMMHSMGYYIDDSKYIYKIIDDVVLRAYNDGDYDLNYLNDKGQHAKIYIVIKGKRDHDSELFNCHIGCVLYPNGKIKVATPLIKED